MLYRFQILTIAALFVYISLAGITLPYVGFHAFNFNVYSLIAHNYNLFGWVETKLAPVVSVAPVLPAQPEYYLHHPPLVSVVLAVFFQIIGEDFWVGRLAMIFFSCASMVMLYLIGDLLKGKKYALLSLTVSCLIPASAIFGRMIGQEALVLFFCLSTLYLLLQYLNTSSKKYFYLLLLSIGLGVLSDWPMTYFIAALFPFLMIKKRLRLYFTLVLTAGGVALFYLLYILFIQGNFSDLISAFFERSITAHNSQGWWFLRWIGLLGVRFIVYFNPLILLFSIIGCVMIVKKKLLFDNELPLLFSLLLFGATHVLLYPSGSFGHPYWIYYFVPFVAFSAAKALYYFPKYVLYGVVIFSVVFLLKIEQWKTGETRANVWRYELAEKVSEAVPRYERIGINLDSAMDFDVLTYKFKISTVQVDPKLAQRDVPLYAYSCSSSCNQLDEELAYLLGNYSFKKFNASQGEVYVFDLESSASQSAEIREQAPIVGIPPTETVSDTTVIQKLYARVIDWLDAPQI